MSTTLRGRAAAVACGLAIDRLLGEPPSQLHPVASFGTIMGRIERASYRDTRAAGVLYASTGAALGALAGTALPTAAVVAAVVAGRELRGTAMQVRAALDHDGLHRARELLPSLVGRDPAALDRAGITAAVIESVAENTVDAVVAPSFWGVVAGGTGAAAYRALNTMDAMVGHRSPHYERFGWASARADDVANFIPARLTALLVALVRPFAAKSIARALRDQAPEHPSPNAGVAEAAFAAVLGVELGGPIRYAEREEVRPRLGWGPRPSPGDIERAVVLAAQVETALLALLVAVSMTGRRP